jgi:hypothetical protein
MTAIQAREQEYASARHHLATRLERLASVAQVLADEMRDGGTLTVADMNRLEKRVQSVYEATALARATRP